MSSKKILIRNEKIWYHSSKKTSYIPEKDSNLKYNFRETLWEKGVITDDIVDEASRQITRASNKTFTDLSLTKTTDGEWGRRKIIHTIKIKVEKNVSVLYNDAISFSIVQVKKEMFGSSGSLVFDKGNWCENQLIKEPDNNMFTNSVEFNNLMYDLAEDEDFALIQDIRFRNNFLKTGSKKYAPAIKPYVNYEIIIIYSDSYL